QWSNDGKSLYFLASELLDPEVAVAKAERNDMFAFEEAQSYQHIWKVNISSKFTRQVTHGDFHVLDFTLSKDGKLIAFNRASGNLPDDWHQSEVWISDEFGGKKNQLTSNNFAEKNLEFSPDGESILFISDVNSEGVPYHDANLFVLSISSKDIILLAEEQTFEVENAHWNKNGKEIFVLANMGVHSEIWRISLGLHNEKKKPAQLTEGKHTLKTWHYDANSNRHVFVIVSANDPGEFATLSPTSQKILKITNLHKNFKKEFRLPKQKLIRWQAADKIYVEGLLSYPLNYIEGRRYPMVVHAHGGPASSDQYGQFNWSTYIPLVTAEGYFYFSINYRGSRGYGDEFMRDTSGQYFNKNYTDILSGIDNLVDRGFVDTKKVIMSGWSAGGHMTNHLITFTDRFVAASSGAGAIEWQSMFGESDVRHDRRQWFGGTPWQQDSTTKQFLNDSPIQDLWKVKTPTIIFVGEDDVRVPPSQSKILFRALRDLDIDTKLYIAPREAHSFQELRHRLFKINTELDWFNRYARPEERDPR
ncbi:MAG: dipeptidyl aminopeptidase/acylaminoacyl peptidase, partial [Candidatus Azotimanducaceae bacterium]